MSEAAKGVLAMILASVGWGLSPLFFHALNHVPVGELLAHRVVWSLGLFAAVLAVQGQLADLPRVVRRDPLRVVAAAAMISLNWGLYIGSVQTGHIVQASLGYYIFPLMAVLIGVVLFSERLTALKQLSVALAALAVGLLTWGLGVAPWLSLAIASTFALYGAVKKRLRAAPVTSVAAEVLVLLPLALAWLALRPEGGAPAFGSDAFTTLMLMASGAVTALPLMAFSYATQRIDMATVGLLQYINPTMQFVIATVILRERMTFWHALAFALIWAALAIYSAATLAGRRDRAIRAAES